MTTGQNKAIYSRFIQRVFNEGRLEELDDFLDPSYSIQDAPPGTPAGVEGVQSVVSMFRAAFPDLHITLDDLVAEGDKVCARSTLRGTHRGEIFGIAETGKSVAMTSLTMVRIREGRLTESWVKNDVTPLMNQLTAPARVQ